MGYRVIDEAAGPFTEEQIKALAKFQGTDRDLAEVLLKAERGDNPVVTPATRRYRAALFRERLLRLKTVTFLLTLRWLP